MTVLRLEELLARQEGVITRRQALATGLSKHAWDWRLSSGKWRSLLPGVAVAHSGGISRRQGEWAAVLYGGSEAALSGCAALAVLGATFTWKGAPRQGLDVAVPLRRQVAAVALPDGTQVVAHRVKHVGRWRTSRQGLPLLHAAGAALHAVAWSSTDEVAERVLIATVQQRITAASVVRVTLGEMPELTRRALVREVLDDIELGAHAASERRFLAMCRSHGVPLPDVLQYKVRSAGGTSYLDGRYVRARVTVEIDGAHHRGAGTWDDDAMRSLRLAASLPGEQIIRITTGMLRHHEAEVAELLRVILLARAAA